MLKWKPHIVIFHTLFYCDKVRYINASSRASLCKQFTVAFYFHSDFFLFLFFFKWVGEETENSISTVSVSIVLVTQDISCSEMCFHLLCNTQQKYSTSRSVSDFLKKLQKIILKQLSFSLETASHIHCVRVLRGFRSMRISISAGKRNHAFLPPQIGN